MKPVKQTVTNSQMFINMTPATLTGLLVSLFLIVILLVALNCLYNVKTNDQYGRHHLWVGKESWSTWLFRFIFKLIYTFFNQ